jgi:hypothetical protein
LKQNNLLPRRWEVDMSRILVVLSVCSVFFASSGNLRADEGRPLSRRGEVRVEGHTLADADGPFLGLGASYFTALWRCKHDRPRLESDLDFLSRSGFNYFRMLSMVGHHPSWAGQEIAPVSFTNRDGQQVAAWPDYWERLAELVDLAYERYGLRTQITVFADAQLMPEKADRIEHLKKLLEAVVAGRERKIILLEVANEAWQNGFPEQQGVDDLRAFAALLAERTSVPVAITSNHDWPAPGGLTAFKSLYKDSAADIGTWHFSHDRRTDDGWLPVYDCWEYADLAGYPPVSSNEPIGPGASVNVEREPIKLVMAAAFAYTAKAPMYVFHSAAGVNGKERFEDMPGIDRYQPVLRLLPPDLPNWKRYTAEEATAPFTTFAGGKPDRLWQEAEPTPDGCVRHCGSRQGNRFVSVPIGIQAGGLKLAARRAVEFTAYDPLTGAVLLRKSLRKGEESTLEEGPGALLLIGTVRDGNGE